MNMIDKLSYKIGAAALALSLGSQPALAKDKVEETDTEAVVTNLSLSEYLTNRHSLGIDESTKYYIFGISTVSTNCHKEIGKKALEKYPNLEKVVGFRTEFHSWSTCNAMVLVPRK